MPWLKRNRGLSPITISRKLLRWATRCSARPGKTGSDRTRSRRERRRPPVTSTLLETVQDRDIHTDIDTVAFAFQLLRMSVSRLMTHTVCVSMLIPTGMVFTSKPGMRAPTQPILGRARIVASAVIANESFPLVLVKGDSSHMPLGPFADRAHKLEIVKKRNSFTEVATLLR